MSRSRTRRTRRNRFGFPLWWAVGGLGLVLLLACFVIFPGVRGQAARGANAVMRQATEDFGTPDADRRLLIIHLLDNSGSSRNAKTNILKQVLAVSKPLGITAETHIWRYATQEEVVYEGVNTERIMKPALRDYYEQIDPPATVGTNLGRALEAANRLIDRWRKENPRGVVYLTIGTDGGVEDLADAQRAAAELARQNVVCFVHGVLVEQRLTEQITDALRPLDRANLLFVCNADDFAQKAALSEQAVQVAMSSAATAKNAPVSHP